MISIFFLSIFIVQSAVPTSALWPRRPPNSRLDTASLLSGLLDPSVIQDEKCRQDVTMFMNNTEAFGLAMAAMQNASCDAACQMEQAAIVQQNMYAAKQVDSFGRLPPNAFGFDTIWQGSWEECMEVRAPQSEDYRTQFCWAKVITPVTNMAANLQQSSEAYCQAFTEKDILTSWSVCMPRSCSAQDLNLFLQTINSQTLGQLTVCNVKCRPSETPKKNGGFWVVTMYCSLAALVMIIATVLDYLTDCDRDSCKQLRNRAWAKCLFAFSVYTNGPEILSMTKRPGQIDCLHCIRVVSITWIMAGHVFLHQMLGDNKLTLLTMQSHFANLAFTNAFFAVDSFLFLGGLLMGYLFIKEMTKTPRKLRSVAYWILFYVHRIVRLSVPYFLYIGFYAVYFDYFTWGPVELDELQTVQACKTHWWRNILYINNLWDLGNVCALHTWYLSVDMQVHVFSPILLVPLFLSPIAGAVSAFVLLAVSTGLNYWAYFKFDGPANVMGFFRIGKIDVNIQDTLNYQQYVYFCTWVRYTPYIFGALTGYFLIKSKGKKLHMSPLIALSLWVCSFGIGMGCVYSLFDYGRGKDLSKATRASYYNWSRMGWSLALSWVVIACEKNWAGPIKKLMELPFWMPFSRLTYCAYLTHFLFVGMLFAMERQPAHYVNSQTTYMHHALALFVITYAFSLVWSCAFEVSSTKLEKMAIAALLGGGRDRPSPTSNAQLTEAANGKSTEDNLSKNSPTSLPTDSKDANGAWTEGNWGMRIPKDAENGYTKDHL